MCAGFSADISFRSFGYIPRAQLLDHVVRLFSKKPPNCPLKWLYHFISWFWFLYRFYVDEPSFSRQCFINTLNMNNPRLFSWGTPTWNLDSCFLSVILLFLLERNCASRKYPLFPAPSALVLLISTLSPTPKVKEVNRDRERSMVGRGDPTPIFPGEGLLCLPQVFVFL